MLTQTAAVPITLIHPADVQYAARKDIFLKQINATSLGTKLTIPFFNQGTLNCNFFLKVSGVSAQYNLNSTVPAFAVDISISYAAGGGPGNLSTWNQGGNIASIAVNGQNIEINFTSAYTSGTQSGIYLCLELLGTIVTSSFGIDYASITIN
jgi:hypothetical protein